MKAFNREALADHKWIFEESEDYNIEDEESIEFDKGFAMLEKKHQYSQEEFEILSRSYIL